MYPYLEHHENDHWAEWRKVVAEKGYSPALAKAAQVLSNLNGLSPEQLEAWMSTLEEKR